MQKVHDSGGLLEHGFDIPPKLPEEKGMNAVLAATAQEQFEHNLDVIRTADWIIGLGPEGGDEGGKILATGTPHQIAKCKKSHTGQFLAPKMEQPRMAVGKA